MQTYRMILEYDGSRYHGWQRLPGTDMTIQGKLETLLTRLTGAPVQVHGSGRTDAGVHARGQVASFVLPAPADPETLLAGLRHYLPEDIGVRSLVQAGPRFHARLNARRKTYCYRIWNSPAPCVFDRRYVWVLPEALDLAAMEQAAALLCRTADFRGFSTDKRGRKSTVRTLERAELCRRGEELQLWFTGNGFLHNMVRILTGTLVEVGTGRRSPESLEEIFSACRRELAGPTAPAKGLCLMEVEY